MSACKAHIICIAQIPLKDTYNVLLFDNWRFAPFQITPFSVNSLVNENAQNWKLYRLSLARMISLQSHSTHWRATCNYPTHGVDFRAYVRGNFKDSTSEETRECTKQQASGRKRRHGACTSIVRLLAVSSIHLLARLQPKIILACIGLPTRSSAAPRMISQQHSGGLELICEEHDLNQKYST